MVISVFQEFTWSLRPNWIHIKTFIRITPWRKTPHLFPRTPSTSLGILKWARKSNDGFSENESVEIAIHLNELWTAWEMRNRFHYFFSEFGIDTRTQPDFFNGWSLKRYQARHAFNVYGYPILILKLPFLSFSKSNVIGGFSRIGHLSFTPSRKAPHLFP